MQSDAPKPQIPVDPNLGVEQQQAQNSMIAGLQTQAQIDTASIMARFGTRMALASSGMTPAAAAAPTATPPIFGKL